MSYILVGVVCGIFRCVIEIIVICSCISDNYDDEQMDKEESNE